jgi:hypothetical protein
LRPTRTWCPGPRSRRGPSSPEPSPAQPKPARATATSTARSAKRPLPPARTNTFLGARYRRLARRIGKQKAQVAVARSILVIVWHLLADPTSRYRDLGPDFFDNRITPERRKQNHNHQLEALGYNLTLEPAA